MLQPRMSLALLLMLLLAHGRCSDVGAVRQTNYQAPGDVVLAAATFVREGTTTEFATGRVGRGRTQVVAASSSRVSFDRRQQKPLLLVFPTTVQSPPPLPTETVAVVAATPVPEEIYVPPPDPRRVNTVAVPDRYRTVEELRASSYFPLPANPDLTPDYGEPSGEDADNFINHHGSYPTNDAHAKRDAEQGTEEVIKPAKVAVVQPVNDLPTFTVRHDFAPSGYSSSADEDPDIKKKEKQRSGKVAAIFRGGKPDIPLRLQKLRETYTYHGFADFTTTIGDTVVIFMPSTSKQLPQATKKVTYLPGEEPPAVVTKVKTFMLHTPGMVTRTVTGHSLTMQTTVPTMVVLPEVASSRRPKAEETPKSVYVVEAAAPLTTQPTVETPPVTTEQQPLEETTQDEAAKSAVLSREQELFDSPATVVDEVTYNTPEFPDSPTAVIEGITPTATVGEYEDYDQGTSETLKVPTDTTTIIEPSTVAYEVADVIEPSPVLETPQLEIHSTHVVMDSSPPDEETVVITTNEVKVSPTAPVTSFRTAKTQLFDNGGVENPIGLIKVIAGTEAINGTTTLFTSLIHGTIVNSQYAQIIHSKLSIFYYDGENKIEITPTSNIAPTTTAKLPDSSTIVNKIKSDEPEKETTTSPPTVPDEGSVSTTDGNTITTQEEESETLSTMPFDVTTTDADLSNEVETGRKISASSKDQVLVSDTGKVQNEKINEPTTTEQGTTIGDDKYESKPIGEPTQPEERPTENFITEIIPSTVYKTFTVLTTFFIPTEGGTTTSLKSREVITSEVKLATKILKETKTQIQPTTTLITQPATTTPQTTERVITQPVESTSEDAAPTSPNPTTLSESADTADDDTAEVIYKTLYTTYTFYTTFFQGDTTSVASTEQVETNIITSTIDRDFFLRATDPAVAGLFTRENNLVESTPVELAPTSVGIGRPTTKFFPDSPQNPDDNLFSSVIDSVDVEKEMANPTPVLNLVATNAGDDVIKTFYTTYTYFTTIFVDGETTVTSRTEVYTNVVKPSGLLLATPTVKEIQKTAQPELLLDQVEAPQRHVPVVSETPVLKVIPKIQYSSTIIRDRVQSSLNEVDNVPTSTPEITTADLLYSGDDEENSIIPQKTPGIRYATVTRPQAQNITSSVFETLVSSSGGAVDTIILNKENKLPDRNIVILDDQISSESNTESVDPAPTLLLQTSYTTYTYFTTVYKGPITDVLSRLETVTNVVTETLTPQRTVLLPALSETEDDPLLPTTYFTTYTYWTTQYKGGSTVVTSREETVSNVVTPTVEPAGGAITTTIAPTTVAEVVTPTEVLYEPTTYYTTFTYFTTSIIGNSTIINSNFKTVTNIINGTVDNTDGQVARAVGTTAKPQEIETTNTIKEKIEATAVQANNKTQQLLPTGRLSTIVSTQVNEGVTTLFSTDVFGTYIDGLYAQVLESSTKIVTPEVQPTSTATPQLPKQPEGVVSLNYGRIVDADGVSTTFYTTKDIGTYIDQLYARVIESTSTVTVNTERQAALQLATPTKTEGTPDKAHQTGLVRIIDGTAVFEGTTTFYESKVIGTYVNGRYAQIIESTSTFKVAMTSTPVPNDIIAATETLQDTVIPTSLVTTTSPLPTVVESSLGESEQESKEEEGHNEEEGEDNEDDDRDSGRNKNRVKSRLTAPTRKRTFTPAIRPFSSRNRATFNPKRKTIAATSATTITRTTVTPTVTATPAAKTGNRFANNRRGSTLQNNDVRPTAVTGAGNGGRRFNRVKSSSQGAQAGVFSSSYPGGGRGRSTARVTPTVAVGVVGSSRRGGGFFRPSTTGGRGVSSAGYFAAGSSSRYNRIRPTQAAAFGGARASLNPATAPSVNEETLEADDFTTSLVTDETPQYTDGAEGESPTLALPTTTEPPQKRNPLLRFRRPPLLRSTSTTARTTSTSRGTSSPRRGGNNNRATTTTTAKPKPRPTIRYQPVANRARPGNGLFPPRGLFKRPEPEEDLLEENGDEEEEESKNEDRGDEEIQENGDGDFADEDDEGIRDNDYEGSERKESKAKKNSSVNLKPVQIRPFVGFRKRVKRQADYGSKREGSGGSRSYSSRFRRPGGRGAQQQQEEPATPEPPPPPPPPKSKSNGGGRFTPRPRTQQTQQVATQNQRVKPTAASANAGRSQFTLREKDSGTPRYRRPSNSNIGTTPSRRRGKPATETSVPSRPKPPRLRTQSNTNQQTETTYSRTNNRRKNGNTQARRTSSRNGYKNRDSTAFDSFTYSQPTFDGTITVTHRIPEEVTIPVVNGKVTEYRNVVTARPSLEVLAPHQYMTSTGKDGGTVLVLTSEVTGTLPGGATEITQYLLRETPTTSIIFTPTTIRGRFTSFSHIVPSTVYDVEQVVNTVQPQIAANAPLANILLSQLLLGNLGGLQPNINPFLALNNQQQQQQTPASPTTEYKTRATTYVTTLTKGRSTVIPLTFRGKEILTTIVDSSEEVITATEFITDTIVITPTATINNQLNSLLIPALLQAQILGNTPQTLPQQQAPNILPGLQITPDLTQPPKGLLFQEPENSETEITPDHQTRRSSNGKSRQRSENTDRSVKDSELDVPDVDSIQAAREDEVRTWKPPRKKSTRNNNAERKPPDPPPAETSVVTLYVSGRRPGEFSTVVSTVTVGDESSIKKREIRYLPKVLASQVPEIGSSFPDMDDDAYLDNYLMPAMNDLAVESSEIETQSLESIVGDVSRYISVDLMTPTRGGHNAKPSLTAHNTNPSLSKDDIAHSTNNKKKAGHFLSQGPAELAPLKRKVVKYSNRGLDLLEESSIYAFSPQRDSADHKNFRQRRSAAENSSQINNSPNRHRTRVIKLRRPISKSNNGSDDIETIHNKEVLTLSEAQQSEDVTEMHLTTIHSKPKVKHINLSDYGRRTVKIIRHPNSNNTNELSRKRIIVSRKRIPIGSLAQTTPALISAHGFEDEEETPTTQTASRHLSPENIEASTTQGRRRIKVTKKRPVTHQPIIPTTSSHRRRVVVTRRRPVHNEEIEDITPTSAVLTKIPAFTYATLSRQNKITSPVPYKPTQPPQIDVLENVSVEPTEGQTEEYILNEYSSEKRLKNSGSEIGTDVARGKVKLPNSFPRQPITTELPKGFNLDNDDESVEITSQTIDDSRELYESNGESTEDGFYSPTTEVLKSKQTSEYEITTVAKDYLPINRNHLTEKPIRPVFSVGIVDSKTTHVSSNNTRGTVFAPEYTGNNLAKKSEIITTTTEGDRASRPLLTTEESLIPSTKFYVTEGNQTPTVKSDADNDKNITTDDIGGVSVPHSTEPTEMGLKSSEEGAATDGASEGGDVTTQNVVALEGTQETNENSPDMTITTPLSNGDEDNIAVTTPESVTESTYDGPRFIRPTRFSVTRKPQRTRTTFPGQRRRTSTAALTTSTPTTTEIAPTKSTPYRFRKTSSTKTFGKSTTAPRFHGKSSRKQPVPTSVIDSPVADVTPTETQVLPEKLPIPETTIVTTDIDGTTSTVDEDLVPTATATPQLTPSVQLVTSTRLRTFTYIVTRVAGDEVQVTSTTEVKPHVTTITRTVDQPIATALPTITAAPALDEGRALNVATRKMSNGVEVIVAGGRTTMPGVPTPTTLAATTLTDRVMLRMPENDDVQPTEPPFDSDAFVTKTYLTTYTYLTTLVQDGKPLVTSSERVVSNVATEYADAAAGAEPTTGVVVQTESPALATSVLRTTYTYLTVGNEETSEKVVLNTVTAPPDVFQRQPAPPVTNTYLTTMMTPQTLPGGEVVSSSKVLTRLVVTRTEPPLDATMSTTDVIKTYFATYTYFSTEVDDRGSETVHTQVVTSTDVVTDKFFLTSKRTTQPIKATERPPAVITSQQVVPTAAPPEKQFFVFATKTYLTTFTYFTTLLQDGGKNKTSTILNSRTKVVQNIITETIPPSLLGAEYLDALRSSFRMESTTNRPIVAMATLSGGQEVKITAMEEDMMQQIQATSVGTNPTATVAPTVNIFSSMDEGSTTNVENIVTGSTIIFFDDDDQIDSSTQAQGTEAKPTPTLDATIPALNPDLILTSVINTGSATVIFPQTTTDSDQQVTSSAEVAADMPENPGVETADNDEAVETVTVTTLLPTSTLPHESPATTHKPEAVTKRPGTVVGPGGNEIQVSDLLSLGSLGINGLNALGPVFNAMAGLIQGNLYQQDSNRRNDTGIAGVTYVTPSPRIPQQEYPRPVYVPSRQSDKPTQDRSPIYIPVGGIAADYNRPVSGDIEIAESQNYEGHVHINGNPEDVKWVSTDEDVDTEVSGNFPDAHRRTSAETNVILGRPTMEKPLLGDGIPISPGEVITANSDVIIGKPAVMGPRPPKLSNEADDVPIGMRPPPIPSAQKWIQNVPHNKDEFIGPPPPLPPQPTRDNRPNHNNRPNGEHYRIHEKFPSPLRDQHFPGNRPQIQIAPHRTSVVTGSQTVLLAENGGSDIIQGNPIPNLPHHERIPIIHPVDHTSLLVNIQPSQVAKVIIPHGSSTAHVFSAPAPPLSDNEFYDPSPFPLPEIAPEFVGLGSLPQLGSVDGTQHGVGTVIEVHAGDSGPSVEAPSSDIGGNSDINVNIAPGQGIKVDVSSGHHENHRIQPSGIVLDAPLNPDRLHENRRPPVPQYVSGNHVRPPARPTNPAHHQRFPPKLHRPNQYMTPPSPPPPPAFPRPHPPDLGNHFRHEIKHHPIMIPLNGNNEPSQSIPNTDEFAIKPIKEDDDDLDHAEEDVNTGEEIIQATNSMPVLPGQKPGIQHQPNGQNVFSVWSGDRLPTQQHSNHEPIKPHILPQYKPNFGTIHELAEDVNRLQNSPNSNPNRSQPAVIQHGFHEIKEQPITTSHQPPKEPFPSHVIHSFPENEKENQGNQNNDYVIVGHITPQVSVDGSRFETVNKNEGNGNNPILIGENVALSPKLEEILQHSSKNDNNQNKVLTEKESTNIIHFSQNSKSKPEEQIIIHNDFKKPSDLYNDRTNIENLSPPPPKVNEFFHEQTFDSREPVINPSILSYKPNYENNSPFEMNLGSPIELSSELRPPVPNVPHFIDKKPINKHKPQVNDHLHGMIPNISHISVSLEDSINKQHIPGQIGGVPFNTKERFTPKDEIVHRDKVPILTFDLQAQGSSPSPFTIRPIIDDSVVGLSPPPPRVTINSNGRFPSSSAENKDSTHRPAPPGGHRKPVPAQFPPPPYEFDRPPPSTVTEKSYMKIPPIDGPIFHDTMTTPKTKLMSKDEIEDEDDQVLAETSAGNKSPINHGIDIVYTPPEYTTYHPRPVKPLTPKQQTATYTERTTTRRTSTQSNLTTPKPITKATPSSILENVIVGRPVIHNPPPPPPPPPPQISPTPTKSVQKDSTVKETVTDQPWNIPNIIIGSEVNFESSSKDYNTVTIENTSRPTINVHYVVSGSKTVFDDFNIRPTKNQLFPSKVVEPNRFSQILTVAEDDIEDNDEELNKKTTDLGVASSNENQIIFGSNDDRSSANVVIPTHYLTHTHTLTVTTTETTVVSSEGHQPLTKTIVLTKTQTSTVVDTVTETQTLVRPTSVVQTVTTTVSTTIAQYPPGSPFDPENYPTFPTKLTSTTTSPTTQKAISELPLSTEASTKDKPQENKDPETFFVIVNDQQQKLPPLVTMPGSHLPPGIIEYETGKDEEEGDTGPPGSPQTNVLLSAGVISPTSCRPDCSAAKNEVCQRVEGHMRCVCRPGFARMFLDRPCKPTYTYTLRLALQRVGNEKLHYNNALSGHSSSGFRHLAGATGEGLDRLVMQSDLRDIFHGVTVASFDPVTVGPVSVSNPGPSEPGVVVSFHVQLSDNTDENRLKEVFKKSLRTNNFSLGGTEVYADQELIQHLEAEDFDECASQQYHDCSEHAHCFNLRGTYTCSCKEGYADLSENTLFPGRVCSAELIGCEKCHYHGTCHSRGDDQILCECFQWYAGETCHINLKALLIALVTIGAVLLVLLVVCIILTCLRRGSRGRSHKGRTSGGTLDRRAMIQDTSSESSLDNAPLAYSLPRQQTPVAVFGKKTSPPKVVAVVPAATGTMQSVGFPEQRDRSLTVMIPRAKYRPVPPTSPLLTMSTFGAEEKRAIAQEHKLLAFLESGGKPHESHQMNSKRKQSNTTNQTSEPQTPRKTSAPRKQSVVNPAPGALVSAGFEVSATVGKVLDSDTETSAMVHNGSTLRTADSLHNIEENLVTSPKAESGVEELTVSEARSYDETTIQPPTKRLHSNYSSKQSSNNLNNDEGHTMAERDVGSTFMMPQSHLYTPDRGSDISNFDSL